MPVSESRKKANAKWDAANLKRLSLAIPVDLYESMAAYITETGETQNGFLKRAIADAIKAGKPG